MDAVTHVLVAYALGHGLAIGVSRVGRLGTHGPHAWAAVAGASALGPDLDVLLLPLTWFEGFYFLQHRGATHSLVGAPLAAAAFVAALGAPGRRWPRFSAFKWRWSLLVPLFVGAWSQVALDASTHQGVSMLWPFSEARTSLEVYYWMIWWLAPISFVPLYLRYRGRWDDRRVVQVAVAVVAIMVVAAGVRLSAKPDGEQVFATSHPLEWLVATEQANGTWRLELVRGETVKQVRWYERDVPPEAQEAVDAVLATDAHRGFRFGSSAPQVVQAEPRAGGWNVTVIDTVQRFTADTSDWMSKRWRDDAGLLEATVVNGQVEVHRGILW